MKVALTMGNSPLVAAGELLIHVLNATSYDLFGSLKEEKQMNETLLPKDSIHARGLKTPREVIECVATKMLDSRPRKTMEYKPYIEQAHIAQRFLMGPVDIDFKERFPDAHLGDVMYAATWIDAEEEIDVLFVIEGDGKLWLDGKCLFTRAGEHIKGIACERVGDQVRVKTVLKAGRNEILIKCINQPERWGISLNVTFPRYPWIWLRDYLYSVRATFPCEAMAGMEGVSWIGPFSKGKASSAHALLNETGAVEGKAIAYEDTYEDGENKRRWMPRFTQWNEEDVDFTRIFKATAGCAYALTHYDAKRAPQAVMEIEYHSPVKVFVEGECVFSAKQPGKTTVKLSRKADETFQTILIKSVLQASGWAFSARVRSAQGDKANVHPILTQRNGRGFDWALLGVFGEGDYPLGDIRILDVPYGPELGVQFTAPYPVCKDKAVFWQLNEPDTYIRPYMDAYFFGQWFYAIQVGMIGLYAAGKALGKNEYCRYFMDSISIMAEYFDYALWDAKRFKNPTLIPRACDLRELDPCGTIGVSMIEAYWRGGNAKHLRVIHHIENAVMNIIPRFEDGTFYRVKTMWADDLYMSCPYLVRMAALTGDEKYLDEVVRQIEGFHSRLFMADQNIYSHIYFPPTKTPNRIPWGRGNGWIAVTLTEVLTHMPAGDSRRAYVLERYRTFMQGIAAVQDKTGMWHQVLSEDFSYEETSATAMFTLAMARGVRNGWLDESYMTFVKKGWEALQRTSIDAEGNIFGVCLGSGCSMDPRYYREIPTHKNDDHGSGIILLLASELLEMNICTNGN
jgi:rhamnogalacturonyl hydrolase YesR